MRNGNAGKRRGGSGLSRRTFMGRTLFGLTALGVSSGTRIRAAGNRLEESTPRIKAYRVLGRTGFKCSDIGFGSGELTDQALLEAILEAGVNYIDTAESYGRGAVERIIGKAVKRVERKSVFIATKMGLRPDVTKREVKDRAQKSLERLDLDYVDCLQMHMPSTVERLATPGYHEAVRELKAEGRVRFSGLSNHGSQWGEVPETMETVHLAAAEDGRFDVALFVYNFLQREQGEKILKAYKAKNVGATLMKTNPVLNYMERKETMDRALEEGRDVNPQTRELVQRLKVRADRAEEFRAKYGLDTFDEVRDAAIRFVLSHPDVSCVCPTIKNFADLDFYAELSGQNFDPVARKILTAYGETFGDLYCRHACGLCEPFCPSGVPVNTIMRYNHYAVVQGRERSAMVKYAGLPVTTAEGCAGCPGHCEPTCPYGVPIRSLLVLAHSTLTLPD